MKLLLCFFNRVYTSGLLPDLWPQSVVISIPKLDKDHSLPGNFRPIPLTSYLCKLLERLVWVLEDIQGLSPLKFLFRRFRSTADPLLLVHDILSAFENGKFVLAIF